MITDGPLPGPAGPALHGPRGPAWFTAAPALAGLTGNRQELKVPAADGAFQRADDRPRIVVRTGDIQRLAILTEGDRARTGPRTEMPLRGSEVGMRVETQTARVHNRTKHHLAGQLDGRLSGSPRSRYGADYQIVVCGRPAELAPWMRDLRAAGLPVALVIGGVGAQDPDASRCFPRSASSTRARFGWLRLAGVTGTRCGRSSARSPWARSTIG